MEFINIKILFIYMIINQDKNRHYFKLILMMI